MLKRRVIAVLMLLAVAACTKPDSQNQYSDKDVGKTTKVVFGTVVSSREVDIMGKNSHAGLLAGGVAGGAATNHYTGQGNGKILTTAAGALAGAAVGYTAEQALADHKGIEYTITKDNGKTITIVQNKVEGDAVFPPGARVMVQGKGHYQRVLPAGDAPKPSHSSKPHKKKDAEEDDEEE